CDLAARADTRVVEDLAAGAVHLAGRAHQRQVHADERGDAQPRRLAEADVLVARDADVEDVERVDPERVIAAGAQVRDLEVTLRADARGRVDQVVALDAKPTDRRAVEVRLADLAAAAEQVDA